MPTELSEFIPCLVPRVSATAPSSGLLLASPELGASSRTFFFGTSSVRKQIV